MELLNGLDPVASAVAPNLSDRFKFFEDMAQSNEKAGNENPQERQPWGESFSQASQPGGSNDLKDIENEAQLSCQRHSEETVQPPLRIRFGGDKISVPPRTLIDSKPGKPGDLHVPANIRRGWHHIHARKGSQSATLVILLAKLNALQYALFFIIVPDLTNYKVHVL